MSGSRAPLTAVLGGPIVNFTTRNDAHAFRRIWERFVRLKTTRDELADGRSAAQRPYLTFLIPLDDEAARARCVAWQEALRPHLRYTPQPPERLHISLHYMGYLREQAWRWSLRTWQRSALPVLAERARPVLSAFAPFDVLIGPLNAFAGALIAEVHDPQGELHRMYAALKRALPWRARLGYSPYPYVPHVTLGYWGEQPAAPLVRALRRYREAEPVRFRVRRVRFTLYTRGMAVVPSDVLVEAQEEVLAEYVLQGTPAGEKAR